MNPFPVQRASQLASSGPQTQWLVEDLWTEQAVGILGGEPKCCKSFLALDVAVSVASGTACLRQFPVRRSGPVLLFPAEDSLAVVRQRLEGIAADARCLSSRRAATPGVVPASGSNRSAGAVDAGSYWASLFQVPPSCADRRIVLNPRPAPKNGARPPAAGLSQRALRRARWLRIDSRFQWRPRL